MRATAMNTNFDQPIAAFLASLVPKTDGTIAFNDFAAMFRATLPAKLRDHATRKVIIASLSRLAVPMGKTYEKFLCVVGYAIEAAPTLTVDEAGKIVEAA
jgi:hypothetical protein